LKFIAGWKGGHLYRVNSSEEAIEVLKLIKME